MADHEDQPRMRDALPEAAGATAAALVQSVLGDTFSGSVLAPLFTAAIRIGRAREEAWWQRVGHALAQTELDGERLVNQATADPARLELTARIVQAAGRTPMQEKVEALGRVLAAGLSADAKVDEALILAAALDDMEAPHVSVLRVICDKPLSPHMATAPDTGKPGWNRQQLVKELPGAELVMPALIQTLARHGLLTNLADTSTYENTGQPRWGPTPLGWHCLKLLRDHG